MSEGDRTTIESQAGRAPGVVEHLGRKGLLVVLSPNFFGACCVIGKPAMVIGRAAECDLVLDDPLLSRTHCVVSARENGDFYLEDLDSTNGTFLNSRNVNEKIPLHYGDRIAIGDTIVRLLIEEEVSRR